jgi:hypothetical protein
MFDRDLDDWGGLSRNMRRCRARGKIFNGAIVNAVYHASGRRIRTLLSITIDQLI